MATVQVNREEADGEKLPAICMRCGAPALVVVKQRLAFRSPWILVLVLVIGPWALLVSELCATRITIHAPLCLAHQYHWFKRRVFTVVLLVTFLWLFAGAIVFSTWLRPNDNGPQRAFSLAIAGLTVFAVVALEVLDSRMLGVGEFNVRGFTVKNVHPAFGDALLQYRVDEARATAASERTGVT